MTEISDWDRLSPEIIEIIFESCIVKEKSFWPVINRLSQVSYGWKNFVDNSRLKTHLILDEEKILRKVEYTLPTVCPNLSDGPAYYQSLTNTYLLKYVSAILYDTVCI